MFGSVCPHFWVCSFSNFGSGHHHIFGPDILGKVILIVWAKLSSFLDRVLARNPISDF